MAFRLAVHGGAGEFGRSGAVDRDRARRAGLRASLRAGFGVLSAGGRALDAVEAAVRALEDCLCFNAGLGSPLNREGFVELDAAVMDGRTGRAGAVAALRRVRYPVSLARKVLDDGEHVLLVGEAADRFAERCGEPGIDPRELLAAAPAPAPAEAASGTVGAVARDGAGHLAAATSTGGTRNKRPGRVGDSPLVGAGTWADDRTCAVSATGRGEFFVLTAFAHEVDAHMRLRGASLARACRAALSRVAAAGGSGGCVAITRRGRARFALNTAAMPRGEIGGDGEPRIALYRDEPISPP